jgi:hypothetical protein
MTEAEIVLALRAFTRLVQPDGAPKPRRRQRRHTRDKYVQVLDCETTIDAAQGLTFGSYRYCRLGRKGYRCVVEGLFHDDDLGQEKVQVLRDYVAREKADVGLGGRRRLQLMTRSAFMRDVFYGAAFGARALVVGFNLSFDLTRLCLDAGEGRGRYRGGFSLIPWGWRAPSGQLIEHHHRPRIGLKILDSKRAFTGFLRPAKRKKNKNDEGGEENPQAFRGRFLDLRTLAFALTNEGFTLDSACETFDVPCRKLEIKEHGVVTPDYITYNRGDVRATLGLLEKLIAEYRRHPIRLDPTKAYSPASMAKAYLDGMNVTPPAIKFADFPAEFRGIAMTAYFGGRTEAHIRKALVPVAYCDFLSMYATVNTLMGLWKLLIAERLEVRDATAEVEALLRGLTPRDCFNPAQWRSLPFFALVEPRGEILPARAQYGGRSEGFTIGINPLTSRTPLWFAGPDLVAATLLSGRAPKVLRAVRLVPVGVQKKLCPIRLRGTVAVNPTTDDFFKLVIEARQRAKRAAGDPKEAERLDQFLKVLVSSGAYGIFAEMNRSHLPKGEEADIEVYGLDGAFEAQTNGPEEPGEYCFPPIAALIPAAARLMLALLEHELTALGGTYAMADTDSMAIVAAETGGPVSTPPSGSRRGKRLAIQALSWVQVQAIVDRFAALNPYDRSAVPGSILKIEKENYALDAKGEPTKEKRVQLHCYAISAKRYALFNEPPNGPIVVRKRSEHGLGHLLNPLAKEESEFENRDWITMAWEWMIRRAKGENPAPLPFGDRPAMSRLTISHPRYWRPFNKWRRALPYQQRIKPMNWVLTPHVARLGHPVSIEPGRFQLIAPYDADPRHWPQAIYTDIHGGQHYGITTTGMAGGRIVRVRSYADVLAEYLVHPESKSAGPDGEPCGLNTVGLLRRRPVTVVLPPVYLGKESNQWEEVEMGVIHELEEVQEIYVDPRQDPWRTDALPLLKLLPSRRVAREAGLSERQVKAIRNGHSTPKPETRRSLLRVASRHARCIIAGRNAGQTLAAAERLLDSPLLRELARTRNQSSGQRKSG